MSTDNLTQSDILRLLVLFQNPTIYADQNCTGKSDNDVAGPGVVSAFTATAVFTAILSICAAMLDGLSGSGGVFPSRFNPFIRRIVCRKVREEHQRYREVLDRTMIVLADQQLLTGIASIISGYVRAGHKGLFRDDINFPTRLTENNFHLILYLSCLSSSAHLACVITLKKYFSLLSVPALIRLGLIVGFALLLAVSIFMSFPFGFYPIALFIKVEGYECPKDGPFCKVSTSSQFLLYCLNIVIAMFVLYPFWIATINIYEGFNQKIRDLISGTWHTKRRWIPTYWMRKAYYRIKRIGGQKSQFLQKADKAAKGTFWFVLLGSTRIAFFHQLFFFLVSLAFVIMQKAANSPYPDELCDLTSSGFGRWGFGQILPMLLLFQLALSAVTAYYDVFKETEEPAASTHALIPAEPTPRPSHESQEDDFEMESMRPLESHGTG